MNADLARMRDATLRWAVLAPGNIAKDFARTLHLNSGQRVVAVGSRSSDRADAFGREFGVEGRYDSYEAAIRDPHVDAIYVAAPNAFHQELALMAIAHGKPVLIEKPIALDAVEARTIANAARSAGVFAMEAMWSRYLPHSKVIAHLIGNGDLGEVMLATADVGWRIDPANSGNKLFSPALGGGVMLDAGVYALWFAHFALGGLDEVRAIGSHAPSGVEDQVVALLRKGTRQHATVTATITATNSGHAAVHGTEGSVRVLDHFVFPSRLRISRGSDVSEWRDESGLYGRQGLVWQAAAFEDYIKEGRLESPVHSLADSLRLAELMDEIKRQIAEERRLSE